jgi:CDP-glucose 4,6-dehydratase
LAPEIMNEAVNEIRHQSLDSDKADRILGWKPIWDFDTGLAETISWYKGVLG